MLVPCGLDVAGKCDGHSLKVLLALGVRGPSGQIESSEVARSLRMGRVRFIECLHALAGLGWVEYQYRLGVVDYRIKIPGRAISLPDEAARTLMVLPVAAVRLYWALCAHMNPADGIAYPSLVRLAGILGRCVRTVQRGVKALTEAGIILATRVLWTRVPRWKWPAWKRPWRKRVRVFVRAPQTATRTVSRNRGELCREVIRSLTNVLKRRSGQRFALMRLDRLPHDVLTVVAGAPEAGADPSPRISSLSAVGFGNDEAAWLCASYPRRVIETALRALNEAWSRVRDPRQYVLGTLRRAAVPT